MTAEEYINDFTRGCSNELEDGEFEYWLTPWQAQTACNLKKEETINKACDAYCKVCGHYAHKTPTHICRQNCDYFENFKRYIKGE